MGGAGRFISRLLPEGSPDSYGIRLIAFALLAAALADIYCRPAEEIRGSKWLWSTAAFVNFMGVGPIAYFLFGRSGIRGA